MIEVTATLRSHMTTRESWGVGEILIDEGALDLPAGSVVTAVGPLLANAEPGETLRLGGELTHHDRWGRQFKIATQASLGIVGQRNAHRWLERLDGVGPVRALAIYERFGTRTLEVLQNPPADGEPDPLHEVEELPPAAVRSIRESWSRVAAAANPEDLAYLASLDCTTYETNKVLDFARARRVSPRELLERHPYELTKAKGFGFRRVDSLALRAGISRSAPARLDAGAEHAVHELVTRTGSTMLRQEEVAEATGELTGQGLILCVQAIERLARAGHLVLRRGGACTWVHPRELLDAEQEVFNALGLGPEEESDGQEEPRQAGAEEGRAVDEAGAHAGELLPGDGRAERPALGHRAQPAADGAPEPGRERAHDGHEGADDPPPVHDGGAPGGPGAGGAASGAEPVPAHACAGADADDGGLRPSRGVPALHAAGHALRALEETQAAARARAAALLALLGDDSTTDDW